MEVEISKYQRAQNTNMKSSMEPTDKEPLSQPLIPIVLGCGRIKKGDYAGAKVELLSYHGNTV